MMYELHFKSANEPAAKETFTATNDKKAIQRIDAALGRLAGKSGNGSYRLIDANGRNVVRETELLARSRAG